MGIWDERNRAGRDRATCPGDTEKGRVPQVGAGIPALGRRAPR